MELRVEEEYGVDRSSEEYQLLLAYCTRRSRQKPLISAEGPLPPLAPGSSLPGELVRIYAQGGPQPLRPQLHGPRDTIVKKKKLVARIQCPSGADTQPGSSDSGAADEGRGLTGVADRLTQIADDVQIGPSSLEPDAPEKPEDVIQKLVELLKNSGDQLNEEIQKNQAMQAYLQSTFTYALFEQLTSRIQEVVSGGGAGRTAEALDRLERQQIAVAFEVTSRLSTVHLLPMSRAMGYGTHYVQTHHSSWVKQRGGWQKAFESEDID
ncbi:apoptosis facilitator Bcl-2-like protein 14 isoform X1 [Osmerus eperlanus]|uniref:apoptosis facilitator Bcl-2-like protein 14 isoform X1 n=1 Tax=Osmerus eperlanus TaxID=29151 RepID=UPI002E14229E